MDSESYNEPFLKFRIPKKSTSISFIDAMRIIEEREYETDDTFYYVSFEEPLKIAKKLYKIISRMKGTKIWIKGKEVEEQTWTVDNTIFCTYWNDCEGKCKHNLEFNFDEFVYHDHPLYEEMVANNESVYGLEKWLTENKDEMKFVHNNFNILHSFDRYLIIEYEDKLSDIKVNKDNLVKYVKKKLQFELEYCPIISEEKTLEFKNIIPDKIVLPEEAIKYLSGEHEDFQTIRTEGEGDVYTEELDHLKEQAKAIGDEVEKRFRKVLSEFFERRE